MNKEDKTEYLSISIQTLIPELVSAIKILNDNVEKLKEEIKLLKTYHV